MKKTLLAAALVAGFAGVAQAESSVQLYGVVDAGLGYTSTSVKVKQKGVTVASIKQTTTGARQSVESGNRWGLKGKEDLGNGTYAIFQLESGFNIADGRSAQDSRLFGRKAIIGLSGDSWGTFTIGRQNNAADEFMADYDPFGAGFGQAANGSVFGSGTGDRDDASIKYISPDLSGFKLATSVAFKTESTRIREAGYPDVKKHDNSHTVSLGLGYTGGPFSVAASYTNQKQKHSIGSGSVNVHAWNLGVSYDFDAAKVYAMYGQQRNGFVYKNTSLVGEGLEFVSDPDVKKRKTQRIYDIIGLGADKGLKSQAWLVGVTAPIGESGKVMFSYQGGHIKHKHDGARVNTQVYSLGYTHALSKRTDVYSYVSYGKFGVKNSRFDTKITFKRTNFAVGLRHKF